MENSTLIIILAIILLIIIALNHITIITDVPTQGSCSQTAFGCCPDGINSKINFYGTNCPGYRPYPGYPIVPTPIPQPAPSPSPPKPIGGCAGTRYGCCPNNYTPKINQQGSNCLIQQ